LKQDRGDGRYYIHSQDDLYQVDEFIKFVLPPGWVLVWLWHYWSTFFCLVGTFVLWPISAVEQFVWQQRNKTREGANEGMLDGIELRSLERKNVVSEEADLFNDRTCSGDI
jgi:hypothetical protein